MSEVNSAARQDQALSSKTNRSLDDAKDSDACTRAKWTKSNVNAQADTCG